MNRIHVLWATVALAVALPLAAQAPAAPTRAALLYETHCIACHDNHAHWRNGRLASDWPSLAAQVRRWQDNAGLQWTSDDIDEVARYLNATIYRFPEPSVKQIG